MLRNRRYPAGFQYVIRFMSLPVHRLAGQRAGYARISGASQNLDGQADARNAAGCEKILADTASGDADRAAGARDLTNPRSS